MEATHGMPTNMSQIPSIPSDIAMHYARSFAGVAISLSIVSFFIFVGRLWTKNFPVRRMQIDDWIVILAWMVMQIDVIVLLFTIPMVFGHDRYSSTLQDSSNAFRWAVISQPLWAWSMALIKISVALMLLRLEQELPWRRFLWSMIALQATVGVYNTLAQVMQCIPLHAVWDLLGQTPAKCWSPSALRINIICVSTINVATDFVFALLPISFLRKVNRPLRERIVIGVLMALGILTGGASIMKMVVSVTFDRTGDRDAEGIQIGMWSCIEELTGFIAACIPCLRSPFQRALEHFGFVQGATVATTGPKGGRGYGQVYDAGGGGGGGDSQQQYNHPRVGRTRKTSTIGGIKHSHSQAIRMHSLRSPDTQSEEDILMSDDGTKNGEIWCTTEVLMLEERARAASMKETAIKVGRPEPSWSGTTTDNTTTTTTTRSQTRSQTGRSQTGRSQTKSRPGVFGCQSK
ncbi:hypothetical protein K504DRAFT_464756 [Pleomassaria siparia CBS 279.74]|uniref:Rhodopsin domain-containing protein n=1 Tax=Pleomassaria siparia CBS 279.74 TaxID=1314801 RepID=A0A6G1KIN1_9PLEO|nr:hypothetical protein K504DRAFT_464756 [Pleomassaria siparia CBS 279.74]